MSQSPSAPPAALHILSALLTITLTPQNGLISTDVVRIDGLPNIVTPVIQSLPVGAASTIDLKLLDFYSSAEIMGVLTSGSAGLVPMLYADDAILTRAELELTQVLAMRRDAGVGAHGDANSGLHRPPDGGLHRLSTAVCEKGLVQLLRGDVHDFLQKG